MLLTAIKTIFHSELKELFPTEEIDSFFYRLIDHYLKEQRFILALQPDYSIDKDQETQFFYALTELKKQRPIQYVLGETTFLDFTFKVKEGVLIPRPETEELVLWIAEKAPKDRPISILDIGTGSGCIAVSLAKLIPNASVTAIDVSSEALEIANANAELNGVSVSFIKQDILAATTLPGEFDIIVSNPPYVRELEKTEMQPNVLDFEPSLALFVSDGSPLVFYQKITELASKFLTPSGALYFEINQYLGAETTALLGAAGFKNSILRKDVFGNERMLKGTKQ